VARGLASLGVKFTEEALEPVTGYRVDLLLHGGDDGTMGRCAIEVGFTIVFAIVFALAQCNRLLLSLHKSMNSFLLFLELFDAEYTIVIFLRTALYAVHHQKGDFTVLLASYPTAC
jgi:hypothetical protein